MFEQMCRIVESKKKEKATVTITWLKPEGCMKQSPPWLPPKPLCPCLFTLNQREKKKDRQGKGQKTQNPTS